MPALQKPTEKHEITLPPRQATLAAECDVLVAGGGPAGLGAAVGAARAGARVILAERYGFLGGNATAALVMPMMSWHTHRARADRPGVSNLLPNDHGPGRPAAGGVIQELLDRLLAVQGAVAPSVATGYTVPFDPELFKLVALQMLDDAGVDYLFHALANDVVGDGAPEGVVFETKTGPIVIRAHTIIDCTGDGDVAARAGAPFEIGRPRDGLTQPMTLMFRMVDFSREAFTAYVKEHPDQWRGVHGLWDLVRKAAADGELELTREDILFFATPHPGEIAVNSTRVGHVIGTDVWDLTCAEADSRQQMDHLVRFLQRYVPGFENSYCAQSGVTVGVRETRRIIGEYRVTADDLLSVRKFDDVICRGTYPLDIHNPDGKGTVLKRIPTDQAYSIPLRALMPRGIDRLLVAGRCISGTHEALSAYRVTASAMGTGQAAGVAAALAARHGISVRDVDVPTVQTVLRRQGAVLDDPYPEPEVRASASI